MNTSVIRSDVSEWYEVQSNVVVVDWFQDKGITVFLEVVNYLHNDTTSFPTGTVMTACHEILTGDEHTMWIKCRRAGVKFGGRYNNPKLLTE